MMNWYWKTKKDPDEVITYEMIETNKEKIKSVKDFTPKNAKNFLVFDFYDTQEYFISKFKSDNPKYTNYKRYSTYSATKKHTIRYKDETGKLHYKRFIFEDVDNKNSYIYGTYHSIWIMKPDGSNIQLSLNRWNAIRYLFYKYNANKVLDTLFKIVLMKTEDGVRTWYRIEPLFFDLLELGEIEHFNMAKQSVKQSLSGNE